MNAKPDIQILTNFLAEYTTAMVSAGTYTARVEKCVDRIANHYGYDVSVTIFVKYFTISVMDSQDNSLRRTYVRKIPLGQVSFNRISELSSLSWQILDEGLSLDEAKKIFLEKSPLVLSYKINEKDDSVEKVYHTKVADIDAKTGDIVKEKTDLNFMPYGGVEEAKDSSDLTQTEIKKIDGLKNIKSKNAA
ncbi:MAG: threonine/serine exporter family protein, partial [Campylobacter concisus]|nr:threonine/serine exporter family protein [Campylobacter concisus]